MGKKPAAKKTTIQNYKPFVSICTPTFNRRPFIENMFRCFRNQDYPRDRMEWIIVDDGTDKIRDLIEKSGIPEIKYFEIDRKMLLGEKRNFMHSKAKGSIIVYMDDDDYYPPERVSHAVQKLMGNKEALCAGSSEMYIYFKHINKMYQCGPYGPNHSTAGTFAFKAQLLKETRYDDGAALAEEKSFLKNYTIPFVQLDPMKTILVFSHMHNTYDKKKMLDNPHPDYFKESAKRVRDFIRNSDEKEIMQFFMKDIDDLLDKYEDGQPKMKPDVLEQTAKIEAERQKMVEEETRKLQAQMHTGIFINEPNKPPVEMSPNQVMEYINQLKGEIDRLTKNAEELTQTNLGLQTRLMKMEMEKMRAGMLKPGVSSAASASAVPAPAPVQEPYKEIVPTPIPPRIPLNIFQTWKTKTLPPGMQENVDYIKRKNPEFTHHIYGDEECRDFIAKNYEQDVVDAYDKMNPGAYKADLWRYCVLYKLGGIYMDMKLRPVDNFKLVDLTYGEHYVKDLDIYDSGPDEARYSYVWNGFMVSFPGNKLLYDCIRAIVDNVKNEYYGANSLMPTGPGLLGKYYFFNKEKYGLANIDMYNHYTGIAIEYKGCIVMTHYLGYRNEQKESKHYNEYYNEKNVYNLVK